MKAKSKLTTEKRFERCRELAKILELHCLTAKAKDGLHVIELIGVLEVVKFGILANATSGLLYHLVKEEEKNERANKE